MKLYQRLVSYKKDHDGVTMIPLDCDKDPERGKWVDKQLKSRQREDRRKETSG